jgi:hypothetical protein
MPWKSRNPKRLRIAGHPNGSRNKTLLFFAPRIAQQNLAFFAPRIRNGFHSRADKPFLSRPLQSPAYPPPTAKFYPSAVVYQSEFSDRSRMDRLWGIVGGLEKVCL